MIFLARNLQATKRLAAGFGRKLRPAKRAATVVALSGQLGSGKTAFVQFLAKHLGVGSRITSPTFVIIKGFKIQDSRFKSFVHIDAYRLKSGRELLNLGWRQIVKDRSNLVVIEWPENVKEVLPRNSVKIYFEFLGPNERKIKIQWPGRQSQKIRS